MAAPSGGACPAASARFMPMSAANAPQSPGTVQLPGMVGGLQLIPLSAVRLGLQQQATAGEA